MLQLHLGRHAHLPVHDELRRLMAIVPLHFTLVPDGEYSFRWIPARWMSPPRKRCCGGTGS